MPYQDHLIGAILNGTYLNDNLTMAEDSLRDVGCWVVSGLVLTAGTGLAVNVSAGIASIGTRITKTSFSIVGLTPSTTNHLFLKEDSTAIANTSGTQPSGSVKLGRAVTDGSGVISVDMSRASGRQELVPHYDLTHGAGCGHPRAVDLALWHATNNEGNEVKGLLPAGAMHRGLVMVLCAAYTPTATGPDIAEFTVPADPTDGTTALVWNILRAYFRVNVAGGAPSIDIEKSTAAGAFSATTIGGFAISSGAYEATAGFSGATCATGDKIRFNATALGTATGWTIEVLLGI